VPAGRLGRGRIFLCPKAEPQRLRKKTEAMLRVSIFIATARYRRPTEGVNHDLLYEETSSADVSVFVRIFLFAIIKSVVMRGTMSSFASIAGEAAAYPTLLFAAVANSRLIPVLVTGIQQRHVHGAEDSFRK
jgi:hypothetical protein